MKMGPPAKPYTHHRSPDCPVSRRWKVEPSQCSTIGPLPSPTSPPTVHTSSAEAPHTESSAPGRLRSTTSQRSPPHPANPATRLMIWITRRCIRLLKLYHDSTVRFLYMSALVLIACGPPPAITCEIGTGA